MSLLTFALLMSALPIDGIEPAVATRRLEISGIGLIPGLDSDLHGTDPVYRFREVSDRIEKAVEQRVPGDPSTVSKASDSLARIVENVRLPENVATAAKLELAYLQTYQTLSQIAVEHPEVLHQISSGYVRGIPAVIGAGADKTTFIMPPSAPAFLGVGSGPMFFSGFTIKTSGRNPGSPVPQFVVTTVDSTAVVFNDVKVEALTQDVGNLTWANVTFEGCLIRYHGQHLRMGNVRFVNCTFERSRDGRGQDLLNYFSAHQGESINAYVP
jgi:hypothetical protein